MDSDDLICKSPLASTFLGNLLKGESNLVFIKCVTACFTTFHSSTCQNVHKTQAICSFLVIASLVLLTCSSSAFRISSLSSQNIRFTNYTGTVFITRTHAQSGLLVIL